MPYRHSSIIRSDLGKTKLRSVVFLQRASGYKSKIVYGEDYCGKNGLVSTIERTIYEDVVTFETSDHGNDRTARV